MDQSAEILRLLRSVQNDVADLKRRLVPYAGMNRIGDIDTKLDNLKRAVDDIKRNQR